MVQYGAAGVASFKKSYFLTGYYAWLNDCPFHTILGVPDSSGTFLDNYFPFSWPEPEVFYKTWICGVPSFQQICGDFLK